MSKTKKLVQPMGVLSAQSESVDHLANDTQTNYAGGLGPICETLRELKAQRNDLVRIKTALTNRIKAVCRRFVDVKGKNDKKGLKRADDLYNEICKIHKGIGSHQKSDSHVSVAADVSLGGHEELEHHHGSATKAYLWCKPMLNARDTIERSEKVLRADMTKLAAKLPVCSWVDTVKGFGRTNLACIIGETGDLSLYANPAKVWKRLGLAVIKGKRQCKTLDRELAIEMGYSPTRRSAVWTLGDCIIKSQGKGEDAGEYRRIYDTRKAYELKRDKKMTKAHAHNRAKRYTEKLLIRVLWEEWHALNNKESNNAKT